MPAVIRDVSDALDVAIAEFLEAQANGRPADRAALLGRHPAVRAELEEFFADHDRMQRLSAPLRGLSSSHLLPSSEDPTLDGQTLSGALAPRDHVQVERVGKYQIESELGRGGMGVVYRARDTELNRPVALKMVSAGRFAAADDLERFRGEARLAAGLAHPGIVPIYEAGEWQGLPFFAMGLVEGVSLADLIRERPLPPQAAARLLKKIAGAVAFAHGRGVIHRDLKPANILLARADASESKPHSLKGYATTEVDAYEPAITDFGLAKRLDVDEHLTTTGQVLGTPAYMPPEQAAGSRREIGEASDIYSLGAILYAMLTGRPPFVAESPVEVILQVLERDPELPQKINPAVPSELAAICLKCLEKSADRRYISAQALAADLERFLQHEPPEAGRGSLLRWVRRWGRREPVAAWHLGGLVFILLLVQVIFRMHPGSTWSYHWQVCAPLLGWLIGCLVLQFVVRSERFRQPAHFLWSAMDVVFLTASLKSLDTPIAILMSSYLILICASSLFFQTRLVVFTTVLCILGSSLLLMLDPVASDPPHHALTFEAILAIAGFVVGYQVWRFRVLREYYEDRY
jgi:serine/threonine-protein kinase